MQVTANDYVHAYVYYVLRDLHPGNILISEDGKLLFL